MLVAVCLWRPCLWNEAKRGSIPVGPAVQASWVVLRQGHRPRVQLLVDVLAHESLLPCAQPAQTFSQV